MKKQKFRQRPINNEPVDEFLRNRKERSEREYRRPNNTDTRQWRDRWDDENYDEYDEA
jgi:hypothetical protein